MIARLIPAAALLATLLLPAQVAGAQEVPALAARDAEPVVLTGADLPSWSRLPAVGAANPDPPNAPGGDTVRDAHNGTLTVPPDARAGAPVDDIAAYRWQDGRWVEVPVQVDEVFPYFLANAPSDFSWYSGTDKELTYEWDVEAWKMTAGECFKEYPAGESAMEDPVATLDDDDEIAFMASDAGAQAPSEALGPPGTTDARQEVALADPMNPGSVRFVYLFQRPGGVSFDASNGYVRYRRHADADEWIDRFSFRREDPEVLGVSNTGYGPNMGGTVCRTAPGHDAPNDVPDGAVRASTDRFPRDGVTVTTDRYRWTATGRWMVRDMQIAAPGQPGVYGPDLVDRWKGRAFQQSPDSSISVVGFEDEQVNWEANSTLLGELSGPVRAIRETWGADSGTNVTKTETFYRDAVTYRYRVRVHPIPPDGLYTSWDYNAGVAARYYNVITPEGVAIDGVNDDQGNVDGVGPIPAYFDAPDPSFSPPTSIYQWEQVSGTGSNGSLVYTTEPVGPTTFANLAAVPYYRDDMCLDDGTGDDPVSRPWPGEASTDQRVRDGYAAMAGVPYDQVTCDQKQGAWGSHGVHYFVTHDTDNASTGEATTEIDARQWQFAVPTEQPGPVGEPYANVVRTPLQAAVVQQSNTPAIRTQLASTGDATAQITDTATLTAELTDETGAPLAGREVSFSFQGATHVAPTDANGVASVEVPVAGPAGDSPVRAAFAGDGQYLGSTVDGTVAVTREDVTVSLAAGRRLIVGRVVETDTESGLGGRTLRFLVNGRLVGSRATDEEGRAWVFVRLRDRQRVRVEFAGDATFLPAAAEAPFSRRSGASRSS